MKEDAIRDAIDAGLNEVLEIGIALYKGTYHNWETENVPEFKRIGPKTRIPDRILEYKTSSTPYVWVDDGTDGPYAIKAKNAPALKFKVGGRPKTFKGSLISTSGAPGTVWRTAIEVQHPGIEAREFSKNIADKLEKILAPTIQSKIDDVMAEVFV